MTRLHHRIASLAALVLALTLVALVSGAAGARLEQQQQAIVEAEGRDADALATTTTTSTSGGGSFDPSGWIPGGFGPGGDDAKKDDDKDKRHHHRRHGGGHSRHSRRHRDDKKQKTQVGVECRDRVERRDCLGDASCSWCESAFAAWMPKGMAFGAPSCMTADAGAFIPSVAMKCERGGKDRKNEGGGGGALPSGWALNADGIIVDTEPVADVMFVDDWGQEWPTDEEAELAYKEELAANAAAANVDTPDNKKRHHKKKHHDDDKPPTPCTDRKAEDDCLDTSECAWCVNKFVPAGVPGGAGAMCANTTQSAFFPAMVFDCTNGTDPRKKHHHKKHHKKHHPHGSSWSIGEVVDLDELQEEIQERAADAADALADAIEAAQEALLGRKHGGHKKHRHHKKDDDDKPEPPPYGPPGGGGGGGGQACQAAKTERDCRHASKPGDACVWCASAPGGYQPPMCLGEMIAKYMPACAKKE